MKTKKERQLEEEKKELISFYNKVFHKRTYSSKGFDDNFEYWRDVHSVNRMKKAIQSARDDDFWRNKLTLTILFRRKNPRGEAVDYIEDLANRETKKNSLQYKQLN